MKEVKCEDKKDTDKDDEITKTVGAKNISLKDANDGIGDFDIADVIFNILLNRPHEFELTKKPSAERQDIFMCTLNADKISIASARADDNGAFSKRANVSRCYYVNGDICK